MLGWKSTKPTYAATAIPPYELPPIIPMREIKNEKINDIVPNDDEF